MIRNLDPALVRAFVAIVESGSISKAAEVMFRSQSTLSLQLKKLEETVGTSLFRRTVNGLILTASGRLFLQKAREFLQVHDSVIADILSVDQREAIRIGFTGTIGDHTLIHLLSVFHTRHPNVTVNIHVQNSRLLKEGLRDGHFDLVVVQIDRRFETEEVMFEDDLLWVTAEGHETLAKDKPLPIICPPSTSVQGRNTTETLDQAGIAYDLVCTSDSHHVLLNAVLAGMGIGVLNRTALVPGMTIIEDSKLPRLPKAYFALVVSDRNSHEAIGQFSKVIYDHYGLNPSEARSTTNAAAPDAAGDPLCAATITR